MNEKKNTLLSEQFQNPIGIVERGKIDTSSLQWNVLQLKRLSNCDCIIIKMIL